MRYLLVTFFRKPGGQIDEQVIARKRLKPADPSTSNIILDYALRKVEKCVVESKKLDRTFDQLNDYYKQIYPAMVQLLEKEAPISLKEKTGK